jgi:hypothetical protein
MPKKVFVSMVVFLTNDEERTQRYGVSEVSELEAEKALRRYLNDRDEKSSPSVSESRRAAKQPPSTYRLVK